jgi:hypothetical protein
VLDNVVDHALNLAKIRPEFVHPTIANYGPQKPDAFKPTIAEWSQALERGRKRGVIGYSLWAHYWQLDDARATRRACERARADLVAPAALCARAASAYPRMRLRQVAR